MITGTSATAKEIRLEKVELSALIDWHRVCEEACAARKEYHDAGEHQARADHLETLMK